MLCRILRIGSRRSVGKNKAKTEKLNKKNLMEVVLWGVGNVSAIGRCIMVWSFGVKHLRSIIYVYCSVYYLDRLIG